MKNLMLLICTTLCLSSCVVLSPKKYKGLLADKDSLMVGLNNATGRIGTLEDEVDKLRADTALLNSRISELGGKVTGLNKNNANLSADLRKREARLKEVEDILRKRDEASQALKNKLQQALLGFQNSGLSVEVRNGKVYVSLTDKLLFATGSIVIDDKGKLALAELAKVLKMQPEIHISVEGHTDDRRVINLGQIKDNWDLSVLRATSVVRFLTDQQGIENDRITATGKGQYQPLSTFDTPEARSTNRRIEIVLSPKLDELYDLIK